MTESKPIHTLEDDITFEKMKHMPKRTSFYTAHRKLSWQCDKDVRQVERDKKLVTDGLARAQSSMEDRLAKLQETKKHLGITNKSSAGDDDVTSKRQSCPFLVTHHPNRPRSAERPVSPNSGDDEDDDSVVESNVRQYRQVRRSTVAEGATDVRHLPTRVRRFTMGEIHNPHTK